MLLLLTIIAFLGNITLGLFVLIKNYRSMTHRVFFALTTSIAFWAIANYFSLTASSSELIVFWMRLVLFSAVFQAGAFFLFIHSFPAEKIRIPSKRLSAYLLVGAIAACLTLTPFVFTGVIGVPPNVQPIPGPLIVVFLIFAIGSLLAGARAMWRKYVVSRGMIKAQLRYLLVGASIMFALFLFSNVFLVFVFQTNLFVPHSPVFTFAFVGLAAYAIVKHKLLDITLLVVRSVTYMMIVVLFTLMYSSALFFGAAIFLPEKISVQVGALSVVSGLVLAISFQPLARKIASLTDRVFYKGFYDPSKLLYDTSVILASTLYLEDIIHDTLEKILLEMKIQDGSFVLTEEGKIYQVAAEGKDQDGLTYDESELQLLLTEKNVFDINAVSDRRIKSLLKKLGVEVVVTLFQEGKHLGWCFLGPKLSGEMYSTKDFRVLEILAPQIAVAIQNAKSYEEIRRFNITLEKEVDQATKRLVIANNKLQELDKLKDEFVSVASHELRTPMTAIKSYLWMALQGKGGDLTTKQQYYLERAYSSTDRLIKLVNEMLNISRIESGRIALQVSKVELFDLLKEVIAEVLPRAQELELTISLKRSVGGDHGDGQRSIQVLADVDKCKEVLINLIGNSLKFTPKGGKITLEVSQDSATEVSVHVHDTGVGIAPEYVPSLFQKFGLIEGSYQTNQAASQGTGLGLFISKSIVELHGGKIWMESAGVGKGATFSFTLPIYSAAREKMFRKKFDETTDAGIIRNSL